MVDTNLLTELSNQAKQLNQESSNLNELIKRLNGQLAAMNIGLEFWPDENWGSSSARKIRSPLWQSGLRNSKLSPPEQYEVSIYLGFCKINDKWQLAIKRETIHYPFVEDGEVEEQEGGISECEYQELLKASRDIRFLAAERFDELLEGLNELVKQKIATAKRAEALANIQPENPVNSE